MKKTLFLIALIFSFGSSFACINEYRTLLSGEVIFTDPSNGKVWGKEINSAELISRSKAFLNAYNRSDSLEYYSDYAATLIYLGAYQKAKKIYEEIEHLTPNLYTTASNLGTIYELIGQPDSALIWIQKSIALNPYSHHGSEWIHIKILEYKTSQSTDISTSILGLNFGNDKIPSNPNNYDLEQLSDHIRHQLRERITFIPPKNKIIGNLYFDLGNIIAQTTDVQAALDCYEAALEYGFDSELMNERISEFNSLAKRAEWTEATIGFAKQNPKIALFIAFASFVFFIFILILIIKRLRKKRNMKKS